VDRIIAAHAIPLTYLFEEKVMARSWTRSQQRRYREERRQQAERVAARLMGKKKSSLFSPDGDVSSFFGGTQMQVPFQYGGNIHVNNPRTSFIISDIGGV
jgi:hypothetical protein